MKPLPLIYRAVVVQCFLFIIGTSALSAQILSDFDYMPWDSTDFSEPFPYLYMDTAVMNVWQVGEPQKPRFDSAYSPIKAMVTDTALSYPTENHSYFDLRIKLDDLMTIGGIGISFRYKIDSDTLRDGGYITASFDGGLSFCNVVQEEWNGCSFINFQEFSNMYGPLDTLVNGEPGFSGFTPEWEKAEFVWGVYGVKGFGFDDWNAVDTLIVRFNFVSDSIENLRDGWMIDDVIIYNREHPGGINGQGLPTVPVSPNPVTDRLNVSLGSTQQYATGRLYNTSSALVCEQSCTQCSSLLMESIALPPGLYLLQVDVEGKPFGYSKVMVE